MTRKINPIYNVVNHGRFTMFRGRIFTTPVAKQGVLEIIAPFMPSGLSYPPFTPGTPFSPANHSSIIRLNQSAHAMFQTLTGFLEHIKAAFKKAYFLTLQTTHTCLLLSPN